ncbi:MAG: hypothetical protein RL095_3078 [Verrucomicrobiota bacterium]|jgi:ATP-binding cassette subfamily F protein 3
MLTFRDVRKSYSGRFVLDDASFSVFDGERAGLVGPNGAGKSTIFRILTGDLSPDKGDFNLPKNTRLGHLRQQFDRASLELPALEYTTCALPRLEEIDAEMHRISEKLAGESGDSKAQLVTRLGILQHEFEALGGYEMESRARIALAGLGFSDEDFARPLKEFSGGWQMRCELARVIIADPDLLLLDEPTNYLDVPAIEWLQERLQAYRGTMILISHDRYLLNRLCDVILDLNGGKVTRWPGNYEAFVKGRAERIKQLESQAKAVEDRREKLESFVDRFKATATKAAAARSKMRELEKLEDVEVPVIVASGARIRLAKPARSSPTVVELENMGKSYDGKRWIYNDISLTVNDGDKVGIVGTNGMGKSTLMRIMSGQIAIEKGKRRVGANVQMGYHSQDYTETMDPGRTVYDTVKHAAPFMPEQEVRNMLGGFGFRGIDVDKTVGVLSGGEKVRLSLSKLLVDPPNFLLLDEPTTHLDIQSREALQEALKEFEGTLCLVSHDIEFLAGVAEVIFEVSPRGLRKFFGDYAYYRRKLKEEAAIAPTPVKGKAGESTPAEPAGRKDQRREEAQQRQELAKKKGPLKKKVEALEKQLAEFDTEEAKLTGEFADSPSSSRVIEINRRLAEIQKQRPLVEADWEAAATELEGMG